MREPQLTQVEWADGSVRVAGRAGGDPAAAEIVLVEQDGGRRIAVPAELSFAAGDVRFAAEIQLAGWVADGPLPAGLWHVQLAVGETTPGARVMTPLGARRGPDVSPLPQRHYRPGAPPVITYFTAGGGLALDVGGVPHTTGRAPVDSVAWDRAAQQLAIAGHVDFADHPMPLSATLSLRKRGSGRIYEVIAMLDTDSSRVDFTARVPMTRVYVDDPLPRGRWDTYLMLGFSGMHRQLRVQAPPDSVDLRLWRWMLPVRVRTSRAPDPFTIQVG